MHAKKSASNRAPQNRGVRRVAEPDDEIPKINPSEVETLIKKIEQTTLSEQDKRMITRLLRTLLYVVGLLQEKKVTLLRLKELVFGKKSEKMKRREGEKGEPEGEPERVVEGKSMGRGRTNSFNSRGSRRSRRRNTNRKWSDVESAGRSMRRPCRRE